ncbi:hypothetical protein [Bdellovibrio sp. GT3]|uniref:hypothetical protein n=1 Tax=Bdellovibrio sp. GT3 TaxID=3136282 RepID=UPI0030F0C934
MEPELQRNRPTPQRKPVYRPENKKNEPIRKHVDESAFEQKSFAQESSVIVGTCLIVSGFIGFVMTNFLGMHLTPAHNMILLVSGAALVAMGFKKEPVARKCAMIVGAFFAVIGVLGYVVGAPGIATTGNMQRDDFLWIVSPEVLEMGSRDHNIHLLTAAILLACSIMRFKRRKLQGL